MQTVTVTNSEQQQGQAFSDSEFKENLIAAA